MWTKFWKRDRKNWSSKKESRPFKTTALLRSMGILKKVLETWEVLLSLWLQWKTTSLSWYEKLTEKIRILKKSKATWKRDQEELRLFRTQNKIVRKVLEEKENLLFDSRKGCKLVLVGKLAYNEIMMLTITQPQNKKKKICWIYYENHPS